MMPQIPLSSQTAAVPPTHHGHPSIFQWILVMFSGFSSWIFQHHSLTAPLDSLPHRQPQMWQLHLEPRTEPPLKKYGKQSRMGIEAPGKCFKHFKPKNDNNNKKRLFIKWFLRDSESEFLSLQNSGQEAKHGMCGPYGRYPSWFIMWHNMKSQWVIKYHNRE